MLEHLHIHLSLLNKPLIVNSSNAFSTGRLAVQWFKSDVIKSLISTGGESFFTNIIILSFIVSLFGIGVGSLEDARRLPPLIGLDMTNDFSLVCIYAQRCSSWM